MGLNGMNDVQAALHSPSSGLGCKLALNFASLRGKTGAQGERFDSMDKRSISDLRTSIITSYADIEAGLATATSIVERKIVWDDPGPARRMKRFIPLR